MWGEKKTTQMDKQNVIYPYNGIWFSLKKESYPDMCYNMDEPWEHYAKWSRPDTKWQLLFASIYMRHQDLSNS